MFIAALVTVVKISQPPKCLLVILLSSSKLIMSDILWFLILGICPCEVPTSHMPNIQGSDMSMPVASI